MSREISWVISKTPMTGPNSGVNFISTLSKRRGLKVLRYLSFRGLEKQGEQHILGHCQTNVPVAVLQGLFYFGNSQIIFAQFYGIGTVGQISPLIVNIDLLDMKPVDGVSHHGIEQLVLAGLADLDPALKADGCRQDKLLKDLMIKVGGQQRSIIFAFFQMPFPAGGQRQLR